MTEFLGGAGMLITLIVVTLVSASLIAGAVWGLYGKLSATWEGLLIALAGGALVVALVTELIEPSVAESTVTIAMVAVAAGAIVFTGVDYLIDEKWGPQGGAGLLAAITLDGIPENLALGVALIGAGPKEVAAIAGSIFLSNLPEAAGGAKAMVGGDRSKLRILGLWSATALLLSVAAIVGNVAMDKASPHLLAATRCFAAGAVVASLATEVFPKAFRKGQHLAGVATVLGLIVAYLLGTLGKG